MLIKNAIASLAVSDLNKSRAWYEKLFGRGSDSNPMPEVIEWKFERGGWLQVYKGPERAGNGSLTLAVDSIDEMGEHLAEIGLDGSKRTESDKVRTIMIADPDGNSIAFAEAIDQTMAR